MTQRIDIDKMRIFKGDKPAAQFEAGQQKGGNFYCFFVHLMLKMLAAMFTHTPDLLKP